MKENFFCDDDINEIKQVQPELLIVLGYAVRYCLRHKLVCAITSLVRCQDSFSKSDTHQTGRAFDLSVKGWSNQDIEDFTLYMTQKCNDFAAVNTDGDKRLIVHHNIGLGWHLHIQVKRS